MQQSYMSKHVWMVITAELYISFLEQNHAQLKFTCSKSKIETLEKYVKYVQSYHKKHQHDVILVFYC